jgi:hypothetical protein
VPLPSGLVSAGAILLTTIFIVYRLRIRSSQIRRNAEAEKPAYIDLEASLSEEARALRSKLLEVLPDSIITPDSAGPFKDLVNAYWAQQACEVAPGCVVRPRNVHELSRAVTILKAEYHNRNARDASKSDGTGGLFAIRSGGHSPVVGASSVASGALNDIMPAADRDSVAIGAGCN